MNDPLRTGAIFKIDLNKVRSPPVVKFAVPDAPISAPTPPSNSSAKKDTIKEAFNEIYRRTPIPAILLNSAKISSGSLGPSHLRHKQEEVLPSFTRRTTSDEIQDTDDDERHSYSGFERALSKSTPVSHDLKRKHVETKSTPVSHDLKRKHVETEARAVPKRIKPDSSDKSKDLSVNSDHTSSSSAATCVEHPSSTGSPTYMVGASEQPISRSGSVPNRSISRGSSRTRGGGGDSLLMIASTSQPAKVKTAINTVVATSSLEPSARASCASQISLIKSSTVPQQVHTSSKGVAEKKTASSKEDVKQMRYEDKSKKSTATASARADTTGALSNNSNFWSSKTGKRQPPSDEGSACDIGSGEESDVAQVNTAKPRRGRPPGTSNNSKAPVAAAVSTVPVRGAKKGVKGAGLQHKSVKANGRADSSRSSSSGEEEEKVKADGEGEGESSEQDSSSDDGRRSNNDKSNDQSNWKRSLSSGGTRDRATNPADDGNELEEDAATVTRSGRTSIPKKVIPIIGENDEPKAGKGRGRGRPRLSGSPTKTRTAPAPSTAVPSRNKTSKATVTAPGSRKSSTAGTGVGAGHAQKEKAASSKGKGQARSAAHANVAADEVVEVEGGAWQPREIIALYSVQSRVPVHTPDFWDIVSEDLAEMGVFRTSEECHQRWFESVREADERKRVNAERRRQREAQSTGGTAPARTKGGSQQAPQHNLLLLTATQQGSLNSKGGDSSTAEDVLTTVKEAMSAKPSEPTKNKRMGKVEMKKLAQESLKATRDDDIFESGEMQNYFGNSAPEQDVLLDLLGCMAEIPTGGDSGLPHPPPFGEPIPSTSAPTSSSAFSRGAADADSGAHMFTSSHVHKLHYKPQFKMSKLSSSGGSSTGADRAAPNLSGMTKAGMARMMKNGVVNADVVKKQARADLGMTCSAGSDEDDASEDDEEVGSSGEIED